MNYTPDVSPVNIKVDAITQQTRIVDVPDILNSMIGSMTGNISSNLQDNFDSLSDALTEFAVNEDTRNRSEVKAEIMSYVDSKALTLIDDAFYKINVQQANTATKAFDSDKVNGQTVDEILAQFDRSVLHLQKRHDFECLANFPDEALQPWPLPRDRFLAPLFQPGKDCATQRLPGGVFPVKRPEQHERGIWRICALIGMHIRVTRQQFAEFLFRRGFKLIQPRVPGWGDAFAKSIHG